MDYFVNSAEMASDEKFEEKMKARWRFPFWACSSKFSILSLQLQIKWLLFAGLQSFYYRSSYRKLMFSISLIQVQNFRKQSAVFTLK